MAKKIWIIFIYCHFFLFDPSSASSFTKEVPETKESQTTGSPATKSTIKTTSVPVTVKTTTYKAMEGEIKVAKLANLENHFSHKETMEKSVPKKKGFSAGNRYSANEGRSKRTADPDESYSRQRDHEFVLTPEDMLALLTFIEDTRTALGYDNLWPYYENNIDGIESDMRDEDEYRGGGDFGNIYDSGFDPYMADMRNYQEEGYTASDIMDPPRPYVPMFRRAIL